MTVHLRAEKLSGSSPSKVTSCKSILLIFAIAAGVAWQLSSFLTKDRARRPKIQTNAKNVLNHLKNLQSIAESHGSSRSVINGHLASAEYVMQNLALYNKTWKSWTEDVVVKVQVDKKEPKLGVEFGNERLNFLPRIDVGVARGSGSYKGRLALKFPSGCAFKGFAEEWGAVIDGTDSTSNCTSCQRMLHAIELGARAVIFVSRPGNQDGYPHSMPPSPGRCGRWPIATEPMSRVAVLSLGDAAGFKLLSIMASNSKVMADFDVESAFENFTSKNVLAETIKGDANNVVLFGSHLDGVPAGPGVNDDGSGSMGTLELARALAESPLKGKNKAKIRLAFWTGEEIGLLGSTAYVANLVEHNPEELMKIKITLDIDMIGNYN